jgi:hypothetical protein
MINPILDTHTSASRGEERVFSAKNESGLLSIVRIALD